MSVSLETQPTGQLQRSASSRTSGRLAALAHKRLAVEKSSPTTSEAKRRTSKISVSLTKQVRRDPSDLVSAEPSKAITMGMSAKPYTPGEEDDFDLEDNSDLASSMDTAFTKLGIKFKPNMREPYSRVPGAYREFEQWKKDMLDKDGSAEDVKGLLARAARVDEEPWGPAYDDDDDDDDDEEGVGGGCFVVVAGEEDMGHEERHGSMDFGAPTARHPCRKGQAGNGDLEKGEIPSNGGTSSSSASDFSPLKRKRAPTMSVVQSMGTTKTSIESPTGGGNKSTRVTPDIAACAEILIGLRDNLSPAEGGVANQIPINSSPNSSSTRPPTFADPSHTARAKPSFVMPFSSSGTVQLPIPANLCSPYFGPSADYRSAMGYPLSLGYPDTGSFRTIQSKVPLTKPRPTPPSMHEVGPCPHLSIVERVNKRPGRATDEEVKKDGNRSRAKKRKTSSATSIAAPTPHQPPATMTAVPIPTTERQTPEGSLKADEARTNINITTIPHRRTSPCEPSTPAASASSHPPMYSSPHSNIPLNIHSIPSAASLISMDSSQYLL
ncbi:hypothetical protein HDV00_002158 [Rhizophlyctis rosea]|nr:hypothetical protein HDV00_002158 [Rhizophlyctis rosea]